MATNFEKLQKLLEELFQLDQADLDFGIYRIMNQKRDEVVRFLEKDLLPQVKEAFGHYKSADKAGLKQELDKLVAQITGAGMNPDDSPKVQDLRQQMDNSSVDVTALENEVFSHLFSFFRRYYHEGDFISLRRYKEGVYAIPYEGEEVKLHWANHDQYYVKSSEYFRDYIFTMPSGKRVRVHLVAASSEQDNKKEAPGKERRFIISEEDPIYEENGELFIQFEYKPDDGKKKQDALNQEAIERVLKAKGFEDWARELGKPVPTKANPNRTVLEKHLTQYTARNTFDYFIHKDLGGFLRRELDFYIKNEVMQLDDIEHDTVPRVEQYLSKIKVIRKIAHKIIQFLEQLENFQKKLWLKKKFVVETNYCITLDRVPEAIYPEIAANDSQREEWVRLFAINEIKRDLTHPGYSKPLTVEFLKANQHLQVDTTFFARGFADRIFADMPYRFDGVLVHGENFHALSLLSSDSRASQHFVYIDPPYNREEDGFLYKDNYQHSTWISMMRDRLLAGRQLLRPDGLLMISIDRGEMHRLTLVADDVFGEANRVAEFVWEKGRKNDSKHVSLTHEYFIVYAKDYEALKATYPTWREPKEGVPETMAEFARLRAQLGDDFDEIKQQLWSYVIRNIDPHAARSILLFSKLDAGGLFRDDTDISWPKPGGPKYDVINRATGDVAVVPPNGWRWKEDTCLRMLADGELDFDPDNPRRLRKKRYLHENDDQVKVTTLYKQSKAATRQLRDIMGGDVFDNPKDAELVASLIDYMAPRDGLICDYFAGSGVTALSTMLLNRRDGGSRCYTLVEVGSHFDTVLKPRVQRSAYSHEWKDGRPLRTAGFSHTIKYIRLESYEDALNSLEMNRTDQQASLLEQVDGLREQYVLSYMLDVESRGSQSLLNVESFRNPDQYKLRVERHGETQLVNVDLVETFNFLLGLSVKHIDEIRGVRVVEGTNPDGDRTLVLWRNLDVTDNNALDDWFKKQDYNTKDQEYDLIYVNGDNNLENLRRGDQTWKVRLTEEEFGRLMFDVQDV